MRLLKLGALLAVCLIVGSALGPQGALVLVALMVLVTLFIYIGKR